MHGIQRLQCTSLANQMPSNGVAVAWAKGRACTKGLHSCCPDPVKLPVGQPCAQWP
jgi:hypothetical protein